MDCSPPGSSAHGDSPGKNTGVLPCPPPGDLANPGLNPGLPHCRQILYCPSHLERKVTVKSSSIKVNECVIGVLLIMFAKSFSLVLALSK